MKNVAYTVEDYLELLVGLKGQGGFQVDNSDVSFLQSIGRQVFKGTALTDRQHSVVKEKLQKYENQFTALGYTTLDQSLDTLRLPLREIDRSKYVALVNHSDTVDNNEVYESYKEKWKWIKVRFPFSKKLIVLIEEVLYSIPRYKYVHKKGSHEHYFQLNEKNIYEIVSRFKNKNFDIDEYLLGEYESLEYMNNNKEKYIPGVYNFKLKNLSDRAVDYIVSSVGEPSPDNLALYRDRQQLFGLHYFDDQELSNSLQQLTVLSKKIVTRTNSNVFAGKEKYTINNIAESILELNRFPLLVILPDNDPLSGLCTVHRALDGFIENNMSTVMFRLDNQSNSDFNDYIRKHNLNSTLDKNTKVVYINNNNIPKPLVLSNWKPSAALLMSSSRPHTRIGVYVEDLDLVIHYDDQPSQLMRRNLDIL